MKKFVILLVCVLFLVLLGIGVVNGADKIKIGISMDSLQSQFWVANLDGMKEEAERLGAEVIVVIADGDTTKQLQQIENLLSRGVDAIICAPKDNKAIVSAIKKANQENIPFLINNRAAAEGAEVALEVGSDSRSMAMKEAQWLVEKARKENKKYKVLMLIGDLKDVNAIIRDDGFTEVAEDNSDVMEIVAKVPTEWKPEKALTGTINALQANKDINVIFIPSDSLLPSVISALQQSNRYFKTGSPNHVVIATFDGAKVALDAIKEGYVDIVLVQDAILTGELLVQGAVKLARGEELSFENIEGFEMGGKDQPNKIYEKGFAVTQENFEETAYRAWGYAGLN